MTTEPASLIRVAAFHRCFQWIRAVGLALALVTAWVGTASALTATPSTYTYSTTATGTSWLRSTNWTGGPANTFPGQNASPTITAPEGNKFDTADFGAVASGVSSIGISFGNNLNDGVSADATANGVFGAGVLELTSAATSGITIGRSDNATGVARFEMFGVTIGQNANVILRNNSTSDLTLTGIVGNNGVKTPMNFRLVNATLNNIVIDGTGNINFACAIDEPGVTRALGVAGSGAGVVNITSTANTYTGGLLLTGAEVRMTGDGSFGAVPTVSTPGYITINGGRLASPGTGVTYEINGKRGIQLGAAAGTSISALASDTLTYNGIIGDISGQTGALVKQGAGFLQLGGANNYSGATTVANGTLQLVASNSLPIATTLNFGLSTSANQGLLDLHGNNQQVAGLVSVAGLNALPSLNTVTTYTGSSTLTLGGVGIYSYGSSNAANTGTITGAVALSKTGTGRQLFGGPNTYTGGTTLAGGVLMVNNATGSATGTGAVMVTNAGTTLCGVGSVSGPVTIQAGAIIGAGFVSTANSPSTTGVLGVGALTLLSNSACSADVLGTTAGTGYDRISVTGTVTLAGTLSILTGGYVPPGGSVLFLILNDGTDAITGGFDAVTGMPAGFKLDYVANSANGSMIGGNDLAIVPIPEPAMVLGGFLLLAVLAGSQRGRLGGWIREVRALAAGAGRLPLAVVLGTPPLTIAPL